jgi:hypothetical protein
MTQNKLMEELSTIALAEFDAETKFKAMAAQENPERGIASLDKLDAHFSNSDNTGLQAGSPRVKATARAKGVIALLVPIKIT